MNTNVGRNGAAEQTRKQPAHDSRAPSNRELRRKLLVGGIAAGTIITLPSRPALANNCSFLSTGLSANPSHQLQFSCYGYSHGYYKNHPQTCWPLPILKTDLLSTYLPSVMVLGIGDTMQAALEAGGLLGNLAGAVLNAAAYGVHFGYTVIPATGPGSLNDAIVAYLKIPGNTTDSLNNLLDKANNRESGPQPTVGCGG